MKLSNPLSLIFSALFTVSSISSAVEEFYGTREPFAEEAIYFAMTDRFVDGDPGNNHEDQGGEFPTFDQKLIGPEGQEANVGYQGGDLKGVLDSADYLWDLGFTAVWLTPVMDNPDEHFSGGEPIEYGGSFKDGGKTGYHGYWINNFFVEDEHYVSEGLDFEAYARKMKEKGFKIVFDIVTNHGSPSFTMPEDQPKFGELYDRDGNLVADHQNLPPEDLDPNNPLHAFFRTEKDIAELSNMNDENPDVMNYFLDAYLEWIDKGADVFRIDTIKHVPHRFWKIFTDEIRKKHPGFYMFGESFNYDANFLAQHTLEKNGAVSVLDFPCREKMIQVFGKQTETEDGEVVEKGYEVFESYLHLTHGPYQNPYELVTFYDNHDMTRIDADTNGFIDANNWLFTTRGIPCVYYGSEIGFMAGKAEHEGNRNFFGSKRVEEAKAHEIYRALRTIANARKNYPALQRGLQLNEKLEGDEAVFYRVLQEKGFTQTVLVMLNKSDQKSKITAENFLQSGNWIEVLDGEETSVKKSGRLVADVPAHGVRIWVNHDPITDEALLKELRLLMAYK